MKSRSIVVAVLAILGFWLLRMGMDSDWSGGMQGVALLAGLALFVGATWWLMQGYQHDQDDGIVTNPTLAHFLFDSIRSAPLWLGARVFLGYEWFQASCRGADAYERHAGGLSLDRFLLPIFGAPWRPGKLFARNEPVPV